MGWGGEKVLGKGKWKQWWWALFGAEHLFFFFVLFNLQFFRGKEKRKNKKEMRGV